MLKKVVGVAESMDRKFLYLCEDFQDYELQHAAWRQVIIRLDYFTTWHKLSISHFITTRIREVNHL